MNTKTTCKHNPLYFQRWSRKGYAAFCSLGREVTIGHVAKSITEVSLSKQKGTCATDASAIACLLILSSENQDEEALQLATATFTSQDSLALLLSIYDAQASVAPSRITYKEKTKTVPALHVR